MARLFPFVQFEFTHSIGPPPGRYTVGSGKQLGSADVVVIKPQGATRWRSGAMRRRAKDVADDQEPVDVLVSLATVVFGTSLFPDAAPARAFLAGAKASVEEQDRLLLRGLGLLNRVVEAHRLCAADPYALDVTPIDARTSRIGYGTAEDVVAGHWEAAVAVRPRTAPRVKTEERLMPVDAMTAMLADRAGAFESEELILRAVLDLDHGRARSAAVGIEAAQGLLLGEIEGVTLMPEARSRLDRILAAQEEVTELARQARRGPLTEEQVERLRTLVEQVGAFVDVWRYKPLGYSEPRVATT